uniref:Uncharacterized protein n=1 Tax=Candidatus Methanogaster sp. ANME-2c ERB4 TaxID=2759911 RepID=A0A7G9YGH2_9EURY|nr:hypothetical protein ONOHIMFI_00032 [Methanosarcinales archaeon ANME-2c ERB4]
MAEIIVHERTGDLAGAIRSEVKEDDRIIISDRGVVIHDCWQHELIGLASCVRLLHGIRRTLCGYALAGNKGTIRFFYPIPAVITVHRIVSAHHSAHAVSVDRAINRADIFKSAFGRHIPAVEKRMYLCAHPHCRHHLQKSAEVCDVAMHAAVREKPDQVQAGTVRLCVFDRMP